MEKLLTLLSTVRNDVDFLNEENLVDGGILHSLDIIQIVTAIDDEYGIKIPIKMLKPQNFNSAAALLNMIEEIMED